MLYFLSMDILSNLGNFFVSILSGAIVIVAIVIVFLALLTWKKPDLGFAIIGGLLKAGWKILVGLGKLLWRGKKVFLVLGVSSALFLFTMIILNAYSWSQSAQLLISLVFSSTATATLVTAMKRKRDTALKLLVLTATGTAASFLVVLLLPSLVTVTGEWNLTLLCGIGSAVLIGSIVAIVYTRYQNRLAREGVEKELARELELSNQPPIPLENTSICLRVVRIPENYMENLKEHAETQLTALRDPRYASQANTESHIFSGVPQFQGLIKALAGGISVALRTDFDHGMATIRFFTEPEHLLKLKKILESHIPGLELKTETANHNHIPLDGQVSVVRLEDAIPNSPTPLSPTHDYFIQNGLSGMVYICITPHGGARETLSNTWMNYTYKQIKKREKEDGNAINYHDEQRMQRMRKTLEEGRTRVGVYAAVYNSDGSANPSLDTLASVLASGFRTNNGSGSARVSARTPRTLLKFQGVQAGANLELTNPEAAAVFQIQTPVETRGFSVDKTADFSVSSPGSEGEEGLWLGWLTRGSRILEEKAYLDLNSVNQHVLVGGSTGSGKSKFLQGLCDRLWKLKIPVIVIESAKTEYRILSRLFPVHIITVGKEPVSPLRLNPLEVPEGVSLDSHISSLVSIFRYAFAMQPPLPEVLKASLYECYRNAGWDDTNDVRGVTPCLLNLVDAMRRVVGRSTYDMETKMNIESAGITRIGDLAVGSLGAMTLGYESTPFSVYKERPMIIELDAVGEEEKTLVASLILLWIYNHLRGEGPSQKLKMVVIVEEAHRIAEDKRQGPSSEGRNRESLSNLFVSRLLKEGRGYGLGVILADQNPVNLSEDALKNTNTKVIFSLPDVNDRRRLGESVGLNENQIDAIISLKKGQAILWTQGHNPTKIQVRNIEKEMKERGLNTTYPTDDEVREYMTPFFEKHPELRDIHPHVRSNPSEIYLPPASVKNKSTPRKRVSTLHGIQAYCEEMCARPRWKKIFQSLTTEELREEYIHRTAQNIATYYKIPDIEPISKTLREIVEKQGEETKHELG
nr:ATP-binding protein [Candidatus Freyarchaeota archaeon]